MSAGGSMSHRRIWVASAAAAVLTVGLLAPSGTSTAAPPDNAQPAAGPAVKLAAGETALVRFRLPNEAMLRDLVASGADVAARPRTTLGQVQVDLVVTGQELAALTASGAVATQLIQ